MVRNLNGYWTIRGTIYIWLVISIIYIKPFGSIILVTLVRCVSDIQFVTKQVYTKQFNNFNFYWTSRPWCIVLAMYHYVCTRCIHCGILPMKVQWNKSSQQVHYSSKNLGYFSLSYMYTTAGCSWHPFFFTIYYLPIKFFFRQISR